MNTIQLKFYVTVSIPVEDDDDTSFIDAKNLIEDTIYELAEDNEWAVDDIEVK